MQQAGKIIENLFKAKPSTAIGLDLSPSSVKLLEFKRQGEGYQVTGFSVVPLLGNSIQASGIKDPEKVGEALKLALARARTTRKNAALAVPSSAVISKVIQLDSALSERELEEQIQLEADRYVPYPIEEVSLDFSVLGPSDKHPNLMDVFLVASRRENVEERVDVAEDAGLKVSLVDVESYALQRATELIAHQLPLAGKGQTIAIIDIGAVTTNLTVLHDFAITYTREETFGGQHLTELLQKRFNLDVGQAEMLKTQGTLPMADDIEPEEIFAYLRNELLQHIKRPLQFFLAANQHADINALVLMGGSASIPELALFIEEQLEMPTVLADPFRKMKIADHVNAVELYKHAPALMVCSGLALRGVEA